MNVVVCVTFLVVTIIELASKLLNLHRTRTRKRQFILFAEYFLLIGQVANNFYRISDETAVARIATVLPLLRSQFFKKQTSC